MLDRTAHEQRTAWYRQARFGMFIHWGLYAIPARGEWVRSTERMPEADYLPYFREFSAPDFNPRAWAAMARKAGMKYAVLTAKHHDGFCLFDSRYTDFKSTNTPFGRDAVREFVDAFRAEGLKVGLYYSLLDWHHPDYPHYGDANHPMRDDPSQDNAGRDFNRYLDYMHAQVRELCENYGQIDLFWFDFSYGELRGEAWRAGELARMVRALQPQALLDNRLEVSGRRPQTRARPPGGQRRGLRQPGHGSAKRFLRRFRQPGADHPAPGHPQCAGARGAVGKLRHHE